MKFILLFLFGTLLSVSSLTHSATVRIPAETGQRHRFADQLIVEVLKRGKTYNISYPYGNIQSLPLSTRINGVRNDELDVFFALSTPEYEQEFLPIRFPIYRGLLGMRLAIVKRENLDLFKNVTNLRELAQFHAGQGRLWADTSILEANGLPVIKEMKYSNLFRMLEADRFDYFPRGINEPWLEIEREARLNLTVDPYIVLHYKVPFYYFVNRNNPVLAEHIASQLEAMLEDKSFIDFFYQNDEIKMALEKSNLNQRHIIHLQNPYLTPETPINRSELWLTTDEIDALIAAEDSVK